MATNNFHNDDGHNAGFPPEDQPVVGGQQQQQQQPPEYRPEPEEIVQVVYQSNLNGSLVGVESSLLTHHTSASFDPPIHYANSSIGTSQAVQEPSGVGCGSLVDSETLVSHQQQQSRAASTLPSVAEESTSGHGYLPQEAPTSLLDDGRHQFAFLTGEDYDHNNQSSLEAQVQQQQQQQTNQDEYPDAITDAIVHYSSEAYQTNSPYSTRENQQEFYGQQNPNAIYSTINKQQVRSRTFVYGDDSTATSYTDLAHNQSASVSSEQIATQAAGDYETTQQVPSTGSSSLYTNIYNPAQSLAGDQRSLLDHSHSSNLALESNNSTLQKHSESESIVDELQQQQDQVAEGKKTQLADGESEDGRVSEKENIEEEISHILSRQKGGAAESGSFRHNFRKKLGISVSTNENDLTAHRQKLLESKGEALGGHKNQQQYHHQLSVSEADEEPGNLPKFKRTHSVSFNVGASRAGRHSVDIRNLPSYLTVKRASIVDVAKGAMSSLMHSFGGGGSGGAGSTISSQRRDSSPDEEPIFEEPIAPTLSLGQRVALVKNSGTEFGTVGWIGQLPDVDDDWIVGVIFDNMIGNCDGAHNGVRYFYARENYAMFVPLSSLTKTDNYIGRPETGTMLSRMSVSLKPGQLISIQRSSIRLQHCFLNAPHQRVGHDVRAVSNRLHCQCHNCGPCAHLTKQGRISSIPAFGGHHAPNKKNSLAHAAVEILAHHHHHYHEEEHKEDDWHQFGDNAAHACNFVRYSCCQQTGAGGHNFSTDCEMVRPELLDNLIHAPRAPHRRTRPRKRRSRNQQQQQQQQASLMAPAGFEPALALEGSDVNESNFSTLDGTVKSLWAAESDQTRQDRGEGQDNAGSAESSYSSCSSSRSSSIVDGQESASMNHYHHYQYQGPHQTGTVSTSYTTQYDSSTYQQQQSSAIGVDSNYNTIDARMSIIDQQRFIYQRDSSAFSSPLKPTSFRDSDYDNNQSGSGIGSSIRRCFACILGRRQGSRDSGKRRRPKKRKLSARNRIIEYRRKQSTFVPSTLAKPHEDFASHGIIMPGPHGPQQQQQGQQQPNDSNSDYSSYSKSSCSSRTSSPSHHDKDGGAIRSDQPVAGPEISFVQQNQEPQQLQQQQTLTIEHEQDLNSNEQLKSCQTLQGNLNYDDYTFSDGYGSYKKDGYSRDSALTDLGYFDSTWNSSSNETLKQIVDQSVNEQVGLPEPHAMEQAIAAISPILSQDGSNPSEQVDISSLTASVVDQDEDSMCQKMGYLNLEKSFPPDSPDSNNNQ